MGPEDHAPSTGAYLPVPWLKRHQQRLPFSQTLVEFLLQDFRRWLTAPHLINAQLTKRSLTHSARRRSVSGTQWWGWNKSNILQSALRHLLLQGQTWKEIRVVQSPAKRRQLWRRWRGHTSSTTTANYSSFQLSICLFLGRYQDHEHPLLKCLELFGRKVTLWCQAVVSGRLTHGLRQQFRGGGWEMKGDLPLQHSTALPRRTLHMLGRPCCFST